MLFFLYYCYYAVNSCESEQAKRGAGREILQLCWELRSSAQGLEVLIIIIIIPKITACAWEHHPDTPGATQIGDGDLLSTHGSSSSSSSSPSSPKSHPVPGIIILPLLELPNSVLWPIPTSSILLGLQTRQNSL